VKSALTRNPSNPRPNVDVFRTTHQLLRHRPKDLSSPTKEKFTITQSSSSPGGSNIRKRVGSDVYASTGATLSDPTGWQDVLRERRRNGDKFTDADFPPSEASLGPKAAPKVRFGSALSVGS
jgi:hypothetical protein